MHVVSALLTTRLIFVSYVHALFFSNCTVLTNPAILGSCTCLAMYLDTAGVNMWGFFFSFFSVNNVPKIFSLQEKCMYL